LSGRVYLFDQPDGQPILAQGGLVVSVFDDRPRTDSDGNPVPLQIWMVTTETLKLGQSKDTIGWGYTLDLPWDTFRRDIGEVRFLVRFEPPKDAKDQSPLSVDSGPVRLKNNGDKATGNQHKSLRTERP
jgi:hypothetical protein